jgi:hypothetical protein
MTSQMPGCAVSSSAWITPRLDGRDSGFEDIAVVTRHGAVGSKEQWSLVPDALKAYVTLPRMSTVSFFPSRLH